MSAAGGIEPTTGLSVCAFTFIILPSASADPMQRRFGSGAHQHEIQFAGRERQTHQ
jgi:hypothetical protein